MPEETDRTTTDGCYSKLVHEHIQKEAAFSGEDLRKQNGATILFFDW